MKKIKIIIVLIFAVFMVSGCSCTSSMCSDADLQAIEDSINEKWEDKFKQEAIDIGITNSEEISAYIDQKMEENKSNIENEFNKHPKACLTTENMEDPQSGAVIQGKKWKDTFKEGLLEGLIVYPISWLLSTFTNLFGGVGYSKVLSIVVTTIIIRILMLLLTFKSQVQTQKMQNIQGEISQLSNKLRDPNLSESERNKISMKIMEIYKKNGINPFANLIPTLVSFPIFISVWSAVSQTLVIRTGTFLNLELGSAVSGQVFNFNLAAIVLYLLMTGAQILSMKLPNIIRLKHANYKNKEQIKAANKQAATITNVLLITVLVSGFLLPSALAIYWTIGALVSILQTIVFQSSKFKDLISKLSNRKNKAKVVQ